jgi:hypothetical protein
MTDNRKRSSLAVWLVVALAMLPVAYVLSYGPMLLLVKWGWIQPPFTVVNAFYKPLDWPAIYIPGFSDALKRYADWWTR